MNYGKPGFELRIANFMEPRHFATNIVKTFAFAS